MTPPPPFQGGYGEQGYGYAPEEPAYVPAPAYGGGYGRSYDVPCGCGW